MEVESNSYYCCITCQCLLPPDEYFRCNSCTNDFCYRCFPFHKCIVSMDKMVHTGKTTTGYFIAVDPFGECPECESKNILRESTCRTCKDCGWSKCN